MLLFSIVMRFETCYHEEYNWEVWKFIPCAVLRVLQHYTLYIMLRNTNDVNIIEL